ncbi:hypothetical protein BaRGS_00008070 [Batillaria attramentaria]|uniref:Uncharacterized protein n=1 Tax=Batillaria attramentaria TaxID=370345 RepID=A0ABD0LNL2_9CAEN
MQLALQSLATWPAPAVCNREDWTYGGGDTDCSPSHPFPTGASLHPNQPPPPFPPPDPARCPQFIVGPVACNKTAADHVTLMSIVQAALFIE